MTFGFSYVGLIYLLMLFIPNFFWTKHKPKDYETYAVKENKVLQIFERIGEITVSGSTLIFSDFNLRPLSLWSVFLFLSLAFMLLYECFWIRYFTSEKTMGDFYSSLLGIPVAGATLPVAAFLLLGLYGKNPILIGASVILGVGHIGIHWQHKTEIVKQELQ